MSGLPWLEFRALWFSGVGFGVDEKNVQGYSIPELHMGFPKLGVPFWRSFIGIIIFWGPLVLGNY